MQQRKVSNKAIGIDLGTTYSCVGIWQNDRVQIIANDQGNMITPSYVAFTQTERYIGEQAKNQIARNPQNTVFDVKRLIGRRFNDEAVQKNMQLWPFKVEEGKDDKAVIVVKYKGETKRFYPQEISAMVLSKMKQTAQNFLEQTVTNAVITVPTYFNINQRQATKDAGTIAGLHVLRIINEPTAAAIAYGLDKKGKQEKNVVIIDLGGGTFDVSLLSIQEGHFDVKAIAGDSHLGGEDFDNKILDYCVTDFQKKFGIDLKQKDNLKSLRRLRTQCQKAKRILTSSTQTTIEVDSLVESHDFSLAITRAKFEQLCLTRFKQTILSIERVLSDSKIEKDKIDEIVLVGGSTRIPKVIEIIKEFFNGKQLNRSIHPDEAIAYGAAVQAAILNEKSVFGCIFTFIPLSLGVQTAGGLMTVMIPRNSTIPTKKSQVFTTCIDNQLGARIVILEGQRTMAKDNKVLGQLNLHGITPLPCKSPQIQISFEFSENDVLTVQAKEKGSKQGVKVTIKINKNVQQIEKSVKQAEKIKGQDEEMRNKVQEILLKEGFSHSIKDALRKIQDHSSQASERCSIQ